MTIAKLPLGFVVAVSLVPTAFSLSAQTTRPLLADGASAPRPVSYAPMDEKASPSGAMARTNRIRMACYPVFAQCTRDSDCCTGFCRVGRQQTYCDNK
jgi:hypothetical protein